MKRLVAWLTVAMLGAASAPPAEAQRRGNGSAFERRSARSAERREQLKKKIRAMRAYTLTEELALDEPTAGRLFPILARYDDETDKLLDKRVELQRRLRAVEQLRDDKSVDRLIDAAITNQRDFWGLEERRLAELRKILTPGQTARLLVVLPAIERRIQNQLRKAIEQGRPSTGGAGGSADDADDDLQSDEIMPTRPQRRREAPLAPRFRSNAPGNTPPSDPSASP